MIPAKKVYGIASVTNDSKDTVFLTNPNTGEKFKLFPTADEAQGMPAADASTESAKIPVFPHDAPENNWRYTSCMRISNETTPSEVPSGAYVPWIFFLKDIPGNTDEFAIFRVMAVDTGDEREIFKPISPDHEAAFIAAQTPKQIGTVTGAAVEMVAALTTSLLLTGGWIVGTLDDVAPQR
ncbi:MAG: hypothetical protein AAF570_23825 [Bacteroidota bacterium]